MANDGRVIIGIEADGSDFREEVEGLEGEARNAADGMDELGDSAQNAGDGLGAVDVAAGNFIAGALQGLISGLGSAVGELVGLADATREYREDMAKLDTAFSTAGHSTEIAAKAYEDMYALLGESDQSVEAANHLAGLVDSQKDLDKWSNIAAGTMAVFQDSLPLESLTESAAQTSELGKLTGPLVDVLSRAGISEEEFNKQLEECATQQERAALITETLNSKYSETGKEYNELTASTQDARRATSQMEDAQADLGAAIEPVTTAWTSLKANALEAILPVVQTVAEWVQKLTTWLNEHQTAATIIKGVIIGLATALGVLAAALGIATLINTVKTAFASLNVTLLANPITLIVAAIAALVAAFIYLWNNCEGFREFWIGLWEVIKEAARVVVEWFSAAWDTALAWLKETWATVTEFFSGLWDGIKSVFSTIGEWFSEKFQAAKDSITAIWDLVAPYFSAVWETIKGIFSVVKAVLSGNWSDAWEAIKGVVNTWREYFAGVWNNIKAVFAVVGTWFKEKFQEAKDKIFDVFADIKEKFIEVKDKIFNAFDTVKEDFKQVGQNILDGIWNGITAGWDWLTEQVAKLATSLFRAACAALGIASPSRKFMFVGEMSAEGIGEGWADTIPDVEKKLTGDLSGLTARVQASVNAESARTGRSMGRAETGFTDLVRAVGTQTAGINSLSASYRRGAGSLRPVVLELNGRELGRAMVDVGGAEETRTGLKLSYGGAY